jgi:hypothetical protein
VFRYDPRGEAPADDFFGLGQVPLFSLIGSHGDLGPLPGEVLRPARIAAPGLIEMAVRVTPRLMGLLRDSAVVRLRLSSLVMPIGRSYGFESDLAEGRGIIFGFLKTC